MQPFFIYDRPIKRISDLMGDEETKAASSDAGVEKVPQQAREKAGREERFSQLSNPLRP